MSDTVKVASNSLIMIFGTVVIAIFSIFITGFIARSLSSAEYGLFTFGVSFAAMLLPVTNLGLRTVTVRDLSRNKEKAGEYLGQILPIRVLLFVFLMIIVYFYFVITSAEQMMIVITYIFLAGMLFDVISTSYRDVFQAYEELMLITLLDITTRIVSGLGAVLLLSMNYGIISLSIVYSLGSASACIVAVYLVKYKYSIRLEFKYSLKNGVELLKNTLPFGVGSVARTIYTKMDIMMLSNMVSRESLGLYSAPSNITTRLSFIHGSIATAAFPTISKAFTNFPEGLDSLIRKLMLYSLIISVPLSILLIFCAQNIIEIIFGPNYLKSVNVLIFLILAYPLYFLNALMEVILQATGQQNYIMKFNFFCLLLIVCSNLFLIPLYGVLGPPFSLLFMNVVYFVLMLNVLNKIINNPIPLNAFLKIMFSAIAMSSIFILIDDVKNIYLTPFSCIIFVAMIVVLKVINVTEIFQWRKMFGI